jgi:hypothetical protein
MCNVPPDQRPAYCGKMPDGIDCVCCEIEREEFEKIYGKEGG